MVRPLPLQDARKPSSPKDSRRISFPERLIAGVAAAIVAAFLLGIWPTQQMRSRLDPTLGIYVSPLAMQGGDPYVRALMRTISASEANDPYPYSVLYNGKHVSDLSRHPEKCIAIVSGPYKKKCSTAAGRYQITDETWFDRAQHYHPQQLQVILRKSYSFEPEFQDAVVHAWLSDRQAWGTDIPQLLRQGKLNLVLRLLSPTWTSLGYGIENNSLSRRLPKVYQKMLQEELEAARTRQK